MTHEQKLKQALQELEALKEKVEWLISCEDKFAELKESYRNGSTIQYKHKGLPNWIDNPNPAWSDNYDYRIKPEEKQTLADDIQELKDKHPNLRFTITVEDNV